MSGHQKSKASEEALAELQLWTVVSVVAIAKQIAEETGDRRGTFPCPLCRSGEVRWSLQHNGHARVHCSRIAADGAACIKAIE